MQKENGKKEIKMSCKQFIYAVAFCLMGKEDWEEKLGREPYKENSENLSFVYHCLLRSIYLHQEENPKILGIIRDLVKYNIVISRTPDEIQEIERLMTEDVNLEYLKREERISLFYEIAAYTEKFDVDEIRFNSENHVESSGAFFLINSAFNSYLRKKSFDRNK